MSPDLYGGKAKSRLGPAGNRSGVAGINRREFNER
jgi:hypothetical protein